MLAIAVSVTLAILVAIGAFLLKKRNGRIERKVDPEVEDGADEPQNKTMAIMDTSFESDASHESAETQELDENYKLPYFTESESEENDAAECGPTRIIGTASSGYDSDEEIDMAWEEFKVRACPPGPVPANQVYAIVDCPEFNEYVKAVVDGDHHSEIHVLSYSCNHLREYRWVRTTCPNCLHKIRMALIDGGCDLPLAMDSDGSDVADQDVDLEVQEDNVDSVGSDLEDVADQDHEEEEEEEEEDDDVAPSNTDTQGSEEESEEEESEEEEEEEEEESVERIEKPVPWVHNEFDFSSLQYQFDLDVVLSEENDMCLSFA
ncbi:unnamed protein product [Caenorhabditis sp. 36 PRJEB53466]|nr:unnamed protein product [Caenorhabditis sp. 36 PRJEB53466]